MRHTEQISAKEAERKGNLAAAEIMGGLLNLKEYPTFTKPVNHKGIEHDSKGNVNALNFDDIFMQELKPAKTEK